MNIKRKIAKLKQQKKEILLSVYEDKLLIPESCNTIIRITELKEIKNKISVLESML